MRLYQPAFSAPSAEATHVGMSLLEAGASAIEAMVGAAAAIAVSYPHMNSLGGDGFWLIVPGSGDPTTILAGGTSGAAVGPECWIDGQTQRGVDSMLTVPGAIAGWQCALDYQRERSGYTRPLQELLNPAMHLAQSGIKVSRSFADTLAQKRHELEDVPGFPELFLCSGGLAIGDTFTNPDLGGLIQQLCNDGLDSFYRGAIGHHIASQLQNLGSIVDGRDLSAFYAQRTPPISLKLKQGTVYNLPAPTQGLASLLILGIFETLGQNAKTTSDKVHLLVEATKRAFAIRDAAIGDSNFTALDYDAVLSEDNLEQLSSDIDFQNAQTWPVGGAHSDTVWMGALDRDGNMVSYIQSLYWEFGSGVVIPGTGMLWTNRGLCFDTESGPNVIGPSKVPRHTLNPAAALLADGRRLVYGTMGGEGQPQTQSALWWRYAIEGLTAAEAVNAPRWLLGRTWGEDSTSLKLERGLADQVLDDLRKRHHDIDVVDNNADVMGHAGMVVLHIDGSAESASDPRSDGAAKTAVI